MSADTPRSVARRAAVLGSPIAHSLSPALHRAAYAALGLPWSYEAIEVDSAGLPEFLAGLDDTWAGLSLTMPLKESVLPLLVEVDDVARRVGAVNTVLPGPQGWRGANTDIAGIVAAVRRARPEAIHTGSVLGAGATARSAIAALVALGAAEVTVCARRPDAALAVADLARGWGLAASTSDLTPRADVLDVDLVVSTLPGDAAASWATVAGAVPGTLLDSSYHPWPTPLAAAWPRSSVASGRDMLLWQAVEQVSLMTGLTPPVEAMAAALPAS